MLQLQENEENFIFFEEESLHKKIIIKKNKLNIYINNNIKNKNNAVILKEMQKIEEILQGNINLKERIIINDKENIWDESNSGLLYPWVWLMNEGINVTLPKEYIFLKDLVINFLKRYSKSFYIKRYDSTIKIFFSLKKDTNLPQILQHHDFCPFSIGLKNLLKMFL